MFALDSFPSFDSDFLMLFWMNLQYYACFESLFADVLLPNLAQLRLTTF